MYLLNQALYLAPDAFPQDIAGHLFPLCLASLTFENLGAEAMVEALILARDLVDVPLNHHPAFESHLMPIIKQSVESLAETVIRDCIAGMAQLFTGLVMHRIAPLFARLSVLLGNDTFLAYFSKSLALHIKDQGAGQKLMSDLSKYILAFFAHSTTSSHAYIISILSLKDDEQLLELRKFMKPLRQALMKA